MRKIIVTALFLSTILLVSCSSEPSHDWTKISPNMPAEFKEQEQAKITKSEDELKKDPKNFKAQFQIAYSLQQLGEYGKAEAAYLKALVIDPNNQVVLNNLADIYEQVGEFGLAAAKIKQLYILNPTSIEVVRDTVRILLKANLRQNAVEALENFATKNESKDPIVQQFISEQYDLILNYKDNAK